MAVGCHGLANGLAGAVGIQSSIPWKKKTCLRRHWDDCCSVTVLRRRLPIIQWLPRYTSGDLARDAMAGINLGLTIIPQSIVFASVANVPLQYGLYSSIMGCFIYCLFGTVCEMSIGPSAVMGLLIADYSLKGGPEYTVLLCFLSGCVELLFSLLNLGFLIDFISAPVSCGFSSAAAVMITARHTRTVLGLKVQANGFVDGLYKTYLHFDEINYWDLLLGSCCMAIMLLLRYLNTIEWMNPGPYPTKKQRFVRRIIRLICTGRNAIVVICSAAIAYYLKTKSLDVWSLTAGVQAGLPTIQPPAFSTIKNNVTQSFFDMSKDLGAGIFLVPVLSILQQLVVAKVFLRGRGVDSTQEILALGLTNILGSFVSALPTTGNLPRSALNANNGVRSTFGGVFTGLIVLLALQFLTSYFQYIPQAALGSVVICAVIFMLKYDIIPHLWRTNKIDLLVMMVTFIGCIALDPEYGILVGIALSLGVLLYNSARPHINVQISYKPEFILVQPDRMLSFPAVEYVRYKVCKVADEWRKMTIVFDGSHLCGMDFTIAQCVKEVMEEFQNRNQLLIFTNLQKPVIQMIKGLQPINFVYFPTTTDASAALLAKGPNKIVGVMKNSPSITNICETVSNRKLDIRSLGSDCSDPCEYTAAWLSITDLVFSIPHVKLVQNNKPKADNHVAPVDLYI